ncbi:IclR family transcriptional regulator [Advenella kashmirensis WT001]|uniref:IclR family transcriptional regulator n=1 Tax=Advenella kashmirensis (strain DSM 17095 / LMG 22695 / WT001) TaxID=1036672 RepID=I3U848_ADVKW|nr:IclR family transcriptional regulator [Advenella kashmirensis]AFK61186.1 IclR family transcriptional regulator [Advenella kashmirensis WT001]
MTDENPDNQPTSGDRHFVTALARGLAILKCFRSGEELLGNQELALRCDLPKSTITRLTYTLAKLGYLHKTGQQPRYRLGMKTLTLGGTTLARLNVKQISQSLMRLLSEETESLISLGIRDDMSMHYIESYRGNALITLNLGIGSRIPIAPTAMGKAYLAVVDAAERRTLEDRIRSFDTFSWPRLKQGIEQGRQDFLTLGCVRSFGDWHKEINGLAVPLSFSNGLPVMVLSSAGPASHMTADRLMRQVKPKLLATAAEIVRRVDADSGS